MATMPRWNNVGESPFSGVANMMNSTNRGWGLSSKALQDALANPLKRQIAAEDRLRQVAMDEATMRAKNQAFDTGALNQQKLQFGLKNQQGDLDAQRAKEAQALINAKQSGANASQIFGQRALEANQAKRQLQVTNELSSNFNEIIGANPGMPQAEALDLAKKTLFSKGYKPTTMMNAQEQVNKGLGLFTPGQAAQLEIAKENQKVGRTRMTNELNAFSKKGFVPDPNNPGKYKKIANFDASKNKDYFKGITTQDAETLGIDEYEGPQSNWYDTDKTSQAKGAIAFNNYIKQYNNNNPKNKVSQTEAKNIFDSLIDYDDELNFGKKNKNIDAALKVRPFR